MEEIGSNTGTMEKITHPITAEGQEYLQAKDKRTQELMKLAEKMLGSSHFTEKSNGFRAYLAEKKEKAIQGSQSQGVK